MTSRYHQQTFEFLGIQPKLDANRLRLITEKELEYGIVLDESIKEWLAIEDVETILEKYSSYYWASTLKEFGQQDSVEGLDNEFNDLVRQRKCIPLFNENLGGRIEWFLAPDGTKDPKVLLRAEEYPDFLMPHPHRFSTLLYLNFWDAKVCALSSEGYHLKAKTSAFGEDRHRLLRPFLDQLTSTFYLYAQRSHHRFQKKGQQLFISDNANMDADWYFYGETLEDIETLLKNVSKIEILHGKIVSNIPDNDSTEAHKNYQLEMLLKSIFEE